MKKNLLLVATGAAAMLAVSTSALADFTFVNKTGENILIQPAKFSKYCQKHEAIPRLGYFLSLGEDDSNNTSVNIKGWGKPGRTCTQAFNIYQSPGSQKVLGYITVQTHDTDGHVDSQVMVSKDSSLKATATKTGNQVIISN
jgi:hypothetical protein